MASFLRAADLLVEIGTEELPPASLKALMRAFADGLTGAIDNARLSHGEVRAYATPRRLAVTVAALAPAQTEVSEALRGPPLKIAFDDEGNATKAAQAFAKKCGADVAELSTEKTGKSEWLCYTRTLPGLPASEILPQLVADALDQLPIARRMRWGAGDAEFVRPVQWVVLLHGSKVIPARLFGQAAGDRTEGHRFHGPGQIHIEAAADYESLLEREGRVIADYSRRRDIIEKQITDAAVALGGRIEPDDKLLDEIAALVEWPSTVTGDFDPQYLKLPREVLISTLKKHQRYFPVVGPDDELRPHFITVANIESKTPARVATGNERVISPRLADAKFFWEADRRTPLACRLERLRDVVYQRELGSIHDKSERIAQLTVEIAAELGLDAALASRAAMLARCDLVTEMVGEFPDLQGTMGAYYARADGEPASVATAIGEVYRPAFASDVIAVSTLGRALVIADRLDTLAGVFAVGKRPTGNRDPFGLRRAALGLARTIIEGEIEIDLVALIEAAVRVQPVASSPIDLSAEIYDFIVDRLKGYFADKNPAATSEVFLAVLDRRPTSLLDFQLRLDAVISFASLDEAESLTAANKRIGNILRQASAGDATVDVELFTEDAERDLQRQFAGIACDVTPLLKQRNYTRALSEMAKLREPADRFFDEVMVMSDDDAVRKNRLSLLAGIRGLFLEVADISVLSRT